jgi:hypothetical protein
MSGYDFILEDRVPVIVFDVTIVDIDERKKKAVTYDTMKMASQRLQITHKAMTIAIRKRRRIYSPVLQKEIAIRYKKPQT